MKRLDHLTHHIIKDALTLSAGLMLLLCNPAWAQLEEIIVTAQKRAQDVQDVPISISAFSGDFIEASGADDLQSLAYYTPNLTLTRSSQLANNRINLRGVGSVGNSAIEPSVAVFIDGVYYPRPSSVIGNLTDLELVEVLRGPQGTLFGRNASAGALNIRTRKPSSLFEGKVRARYGNYNSKYVAGSLSGAVSSAAAARLAWHYAGRDGYGDNAFTRGGSRPRIGDYEDMSVRGKLYFEQNDNLEVNLTLDYARIENEGGPISVIADTSLPAYQSTLKRLLNTDAAAGTLPSASGPVPISGDTFSYDLNQDHRDDARDEQLGIALDWTWTVAGHDLRSITSLRQWQNYSYESALRLPADLFNRVTDYQVDTFSQELQLISPAGERLEYVAGLYYYQEDYAIDQRFDLGEDFCLIGAHAAYLLALARGQAASAPAASQGLFGVCNSNPRIGPREGGTVSDFDQDLTSYAAFGQATFRLNEQLRVTAGLRMTRDRKSGSFEQVINNPSVAPVAIRNPQTGAVVLPGLDLRIAESKPALKFKDSELTWMANVSYYLTEDLMAFATASTGFKSGGFNSDGFNSRGLSRPDVSRVFDSETVDNYEVGVKSGWFDKRLTANITLFRTEISGFQDRQFDGINFFVQNAGKLTQQGVELDLAARPADPAFIALGASYLDSEFDSFPNATALPAQIAATPRGQEPPPRDLTGQRNHFSPKWQVSLVGEWANAIPNRNLGWFVRGEFQYVSKQNVGAETNQNRQSLQAAYELMNARFGLFGAGAAEQWELAFFIKNILDKGYCQTVFNQPVGITLGLVNRDPDGDAGGQQRCVLGAPQTFGVEASYRF